MATPMNIDSLVNDFAVRSFRDTGDGDYIAARLAFRARLIPQFLWSSLQATEKYLKCVLVLNRIRAPRGHDLGEILLALDANKKFQLRLSENTRKFLSHLDTYGRHRYYEMPYFILGGEIISLDRAVWELRRYARVMDYNIKDIQGRKINLLHHELEANERAEKLSPHKFHVLGGRLESIIANKKHPSREPLLWQNAFFGRKPRKIVRLPGRMESGNSPLSLHPEILDEILKYVFLPKDVVLAYREINTTNRDND
ncbi:MAG: HEPN domain-containing protein [Thermodesulfobacteriota bacterium]